MPLIQLPTVIAFLIPQKWVMNIHTECRPIDNFIPTSDDLSAWRTPPPHLHSVYCTLTRHSAVGMERKSFLHCAKLWHFGIGRALTQSQKSRVYFAQNQIWLEFRAVKRLFLYNIRVNIRHIYTMTVSL